MINLLIILYLRIKQLLRFLIIILKLHFITIIFNLFIKYINIIIHLLIYLFIRII